MNNLNKYKKTTSKDTRQITSVSLETKHIKFLNDQKINLSSLIRDYLDKLMDNKNK